MPRQLPDQLHVPVQQCGDRPQGGDVERKELDPGGTSERHPPGAFLPSHTPVRRVAVVGAGITGLTCARTLTDHGFAVTVFDKGRGPGGRTATRRVNPDLSFDHGAQYFTARDSHFARFVAGCVDRGVVAEWGGRVVKLEGGAAAATLARPRYVGVPGMSAVAAELAAGLDVRRQTRISLASNASAGWQLADESGGRYGPFDFSVVALPAPQAAELLAPHPFAIEAMGVPMVPCWAVLTSFADRLDVPWDAAFVHDPPLSWIARNSSKPGRPCGADCWVLHAGPEWSTAHLEESPDAVAAQLLDALAAAVGCPTPEPLYLAAHRWRQSLGADPGARTTLFDADSGLVVCGDWLAGGRVEGAFLSGLAAAGHVCEAVGVPRPRAAGEASWSCAR